MAGMKWCWTVMQHIKKYYYILISSRDDDAAHEDEFLWKKKKLRNDDLKKNEISNKIFYSWHENHIKRASFANASIFFYFTNFNFLLPLVSHNICIHQFVIDFSSLLSMNFTTHSSSPSSFLMLGPFIPHFTNTQCCM